MLGYLVVRGASSYTLTCKVYCPEFYLDIVLDSNFLCVAVGDSFCTVVLQDFERSKAFLFLDRVKQR